MTKSELRKKYKTLRKGLSKKEIEEKSLAIANQVLKLPIWKHSYYHIYLSIKELNEVNTEYILNILSGKDKNIIISKCNFKDTSLDNFLLTDSIRIKANNYGVPEPENGIPVDDKLIDVVFVPLLACDTLGNRVGYGKGFYDNFLAKCKPNTLKIGLSLFELEEEITDLRDEDIPLNYYVSPSKLTNF